MKYSRAPARTLIGGMHVHMREFSSPTSSNSVMAMSFTGRSRIFFSEKRWRGAFEGSHGFRTQSMIANMPNPYANKVFWGKVG